MKLELRVIPGQACLPLSSQNARKLFVLVDVISAAVDFLQRNVEPIPYSSAKCPGDKLPTKISTFAPLAFFRPLSF